MIQEIKGTNLEKLIDMSWTVQTKIEREELGFEEYVKEVNGRKIVVPSIDKMAKDKKFEIPITSAGGGGYTTTIKNREGETVNLPPIKTLDIPDRDTLERIERKYEIKRSFYIVDFVEWLTVLSKNPKLQEKVIGYDKVKNILQKYRDFILLTSYRLDVKRANIVMDKYLDYNELEELFTAHEIFMENMCKMQIVFLNVYGTSNARTHPVMLLPWSHNLNRTTDEIFIFYESKIKEDMLLNTGKTEGNSTIYNTEIYKLHDAVQRVKSISPVKLVALDVNSFTEELMPREWKYIFEGRIRESLDLYKFRLALIKEVFSMYAIYGKTRNEDSLTPNMYLLPYPFLICGTGNNEDDRMTVKLNKIGTDKVDVIKNNLSY